MKQTYSSWLTRRLPRPLAALLLLVALALLRPLGASAQYTVSTLAGSGTRGFADGAGSAAQFNIPTGVAVDGAGTVYVADQSNNRIRKVTSTGVVTTLAGSGTRGFADGAGSAAQFNNPYSVAVDGAGTVYVADQSNNRIRKVTSTGVVTTLAGSGTAGFADGAGSAAQFNNPIGVAVDGAGTVYVADYINQRIRKVTSTGVVTTLAGSTQGFADGAGSAAQFRNPVGVAVDGAGTVYVADYSNNRIRKVTSAGVVTTLAGSGTAGFADGAGSAAQFNLPTGVALDGAGNVYVADQLNTRIRKVSPAGVVTTLAGSGTFGFADGAGSAAQFNGPTGVALDGAGTVYVADNGNHRIRKVSPAPTLTSISPNPAAAGTSVTLTGINLSGATGVSFNGTAATTFAVVNSTTVTATVPTGATTGNVTVTTPGGTSGGVLFTVVAPTITLAPSTLPGSQVGVQYPTISLSATGGTSPYTFAITSGALPAGLTLGTGGSLSGTPTAGGPFSFTVTATDAAGFSGSRAYTLTSTPPSIRVVPTSLATGDVGRAYSQLLEAINGTAPYTFAITSGALPAGLTLSAGGLLAGTPTAGGTFTFTVTATDASTGAGPYTGAQTYSLGIAPARLTLTPTSLPDGTVGTAYSQTVTAAGGISPYTYALTSGTLPTGLVLSAGGVLAGTPTAGGFFVFTITARDASTGVGPASTSQTYAVTIDAGPIDLVVTTTTTIAAGTYNSITVNSPGVGTLAGNVTVNSAVTVNSGATLNDGCFVLSGAGSFTLAAGGTLGICHAAGISSSGATGAVQVTGTRSFSTNASYVYNGTAAQRTGNGLPAQVRNLSTTNASDVTLTSPTSATQIITVGGAGNLALNGNALTLLSSAASTALVVNSSTGIVSGNIAVVQRYIDPSLNPGLGYRHYSSPVGNSTVGDLATSGFTPVVNPAYNTSPAPANVSPYPTVFGYDDSRLSLANNLPLFDKGYFSPAALSDPLAVGRGYTVNIAASELVDFQGPLNNGDRTLNLTSTRNNYPDGGWQLLGNPYPAPLDYSRVTPADRIGLESAIYVYSSTSQYQGRYRVYINGIGNPVLPVGQGFFARVAGGQPSATMTFHNSQRLTVPNGTAFQRPAADPRPLVQLELRPGTSLAAADEFTAYAETGATAPFDGQYDAVKVPNPTGFNLASVAASGESLAIDGRAVFTATTVLPLTVGVPAAGTYALSAAALNNLPTGLDAYLADDLTGQTTKLSPGTSYSFSVTAAQATATISGRFRLLFRPATALASTSASLSAADVTVFPNPAHARFTLVLPGLAQANTVQAELLNTLGQVVRRQSANLPATGTQLSFDTAELATGVYTLRLQAGPTTLAKRVVLE